MPDFIPFKNDLFGLFASNFASHLSANPGMYMVSPAQALSVQNAVNNFREALAESSGEGTRTKPSIIRKQNCRSIAESLIRGYAALIKANKGISDDDKVAIGVRPINPKRVRIPCPETPPLLEIIGATPGRHTLRFKDSATPDRRAKPFGASELSLFVGISQEGVAPLEAARYYGKFTKNPMTVKFDLKDKGKEATYYARWASVRGEMGPWSVAVGMTIAA